VDKLKQTEMKLKLWGTFIGPDGQSLYAVIEDQKTREQHPYRPGDTIQNASVKMVLRQKVVLTVSGRDEVLGMEEPGVVKSGAPGPGRGDAGAAARPPAAEPVQQVTISPEQVEQLEKSRRPVEPGDFPSAWKTASPPEFHHRHQAERHLSQAAVAQRGCHHRCQRAIHRIGGGRHEGLRSLSTEGPCR
jgi:type II secretory pathway component PulC